MILWPLCSFAVHQSDCSLSNEMYKQGFLILVSNNLSLPSMNGKTEVQFLLLPQSSCCRQEPKFIITTRAKARFVPDLFQPAGSKLEKSGAPLCKALPTSRTASWNIAPFASIYSRSPQLKGITFMINPPTRSLNELTSIKPFQDKVANGFKFPTCMNRIALHIGTIVTGKEFERDDCCVTPAHYGLTQMVDAMFYTIISREMHLNGKRID